MAESSTETVENTQKKGFTVVVAVDGSEYSDYALEFYLEKIHHPDNHLILVHSTDFKCVTSPGIGVMSAGSTGYMAVVEKEMKAEEKKTDELLEKLAAKVKEMKIEADIERIHGEPGPAIVSFVTRKHADIVVVGCRGKGVIRRTLTGSVTDYINHHSHVPVIVTRRKDDIKHHH